MGPNGAGKSTLSAVVMGKPGYEVLAGLGDARRRRRAGDAGVAARRRRTPPRDAVPDRGARRHARRRARPRRSPTRGRVDRRAGGDCSATRRERIGFEERFLDRPLNVDLSGGEKKRNETLQLAVLRPKIAILDELDSGLDIDALRDCARRVEELSNDTSDGEPLGVLAITHYSRLLTELRPDHVHILVKGRIVARGGPELADVLERRRLRRVRRPTTTSRRAGRCRRGPAASTSCSHSDRGGHDPRRGRRHRRS